MLYAGSAWSELPISTSKEQEPNGEEFDFGFLIDEGLGFNLDIQGDRAFQLRISQIPSFSVDISASLDQSLQIEQQEDHRRSYASEKLQPPPPYGKNAQDVPTKAVNVVDDEESPRPDHPDEQAVERRIGDGLRVQTCPPAQAAHQAQRRQEAQRHHCAEAPDGHVQKRDLNETRVHRSPQAFSGRARSRPTMVSRFP